MLKLSRLRAALLLIAPVSTGLAGCSTPGATPAPVGGIHATQEEPTFIHLDTMDPAILAGIEAGIDAGRERFGTFGPLRVYVMDGRDDNRELVEDFCACTFRPNDQGTREEQLRWCMDGFGVPEVELEAYLSPQLDAEHPLAAMVFINVGPPDGQSHLEHEAMMATHEYVHVYQAAFQAPGPRQLDQHIPGPAWLAEGAATWWACVNGAERGWIGDLDGILELFESSLRTTAMEHGVFLQDGVTYDALEEELIHSVLYDGGAAAVNWLVETHSEEALWISYYGAIPELGWEGAFEQAFGMDLDTFYVVFAAHLGL